jgi:hypothetical protein
MVKSLQEAIVTRFLLKGLSFYERMLRKMRRKTIPLM